MIEHYIKYVAERLAIYDASSPLSLEDKRLGLSKLNWFILNECEPETLKTIVDRFGTQEQILLQLAADFFVTRKAILGACPTSKVRSLMMEFIDVNNPEFDRWDLDELNGTCELTLNTDYHFSLKDTEDEKFYSVHQIENIYRKYFGDPLIEK